MEKISEAFAEAFLSAQKEMENPPKDHTAKIPTKSGGSFSYSYAGLENVVACAKTALLKYDISVAQPPVTTEAGLVGIKTELIHKGGEVWDRGTLVIKVSEDPQKVGSALTYLRRYGLTSAVGMVAEDDDDGQNAQRKAKKKTTKEPAAKKPAAKKPATKKTPATGKVEEHLVRIADHVKLFTDAYGADRARDELIGATEFPNPEGEMVPGFDSLESFKAWLKSKKSLRDAAERVNII